MIEKKEFKSNTGAKDDNYILFDVEADVNIIAKNILTK